MQQPAPSPSHAECGPGPDCSVIGPNTLLFLPRVLPRIPDSFIFIRLPSNLPASFSLYITPHYHRHLPLAQVSSPSCWQINGEWETSAWVGLLWWMSGFRFQSDSNRNGGRCHQMSGFGFLSESNRNGAEVHFECFFFFSLSGFRL